jgi:hypothetical protein
MLNAQPMVYPKNLRTPNQKQTRPEISQSQTESVHLPNHIIDLVFAVAQITTFDEMLELLLAEAAGRAVQLEWPQEVGCGLEVRADGADLVNHIFHTDHAKLAKVLFDDLVVSQR